VATKFASLIGRRAYVLAIAVAVAASSGAFHPFRVIGFWDGPH
jgi:hypothetical protein